MTQDLVFHVAAFFFLFYIAIRWSDRGAQNIFMKMSFSLLTIWAAVAPVKEWLL